jgi:hypothetical protein
MLSERLKEPWVKVWIVFGMAILLPLVDACALTLPQGPPARNPCAFVDGETVAAVIGSDVEPHPEPAEPESLCRFLDPTTQEQAVMLSVQDDLTESEAAAFSAQISYPDPVVTEVQLDGGRLGGIDTSGFTYCGRERCVTSLPFSTPPYFFIVHVTERSGGIEEAVEIAEATLAGLSP